MQRPDGGCPADTWSARFAETGELRVRHGFGPDDAAADFVEHFAGPPATGRRGDEPIVLYPQPDGLALSFGAYGSERRVRNWLPGLPGRISPHSLSGIAPIRPETGVSSDHLALDDPDLRRLPAPLLTRQDAGRYISMGFLMARQETGGVALSAHRMLILGPRRVGVWMLPSRRLRALAAAEHENNRSLPVSINIGAPPEAAVAASTSSAALPDRFCKLSLAGALADTPLELSRDRDTEFLTCADVVLTGRMVPKTVPEAADGGMPAGSMPEFLGYDGKGQAELIVVEVDRMLVRPDAVFQAVVGPGREQSVILGLGGAVALSLGLPSGSGISDLRFSHAGGGMLLLFAALGAPGTCAASQEQLAELAEEMVRICPFIKTVVFVDNDVNLNNDEDVLWAMTTRARLPQDCYALPDHEPLAMDPSQTPEWAAKRGAAAFKSFVNATVPAGLDRRAMRSYPDPGI